MTEMKNAGSIISALYRTARIYGGIYVENYKDAIVGELEDICGQLGDIEGEYQKTAEEAIKRIQVLIE